MINSRSPTMAMGAPIPGPSHLHGTELDGTQIVGEAEEKTLPERSQDDAAEEEEEEEQDAQSEKKKSRERKEQVSLGREDGKSLFPFSRVQKIIKADKVRIQCLLSVLMVAECQTGSANSSKGSHLFDIGLHGRVLEAIFASHPPASGERKENNGATA